MKYILYGQVSGVYEETRKHWLSGTGPDATFEVESLGWRVRIFNASFSVGPEKPTLKEGDFISLTIEGPIRPPKPPSKETSNALDPRGVPPQAQQEALPKTSS